MITIVRSVRPSKRKFAFDEDAFTSARSMLLTVAALCYLLPMVIYAYTGTFARYAVDDFALADDCRKFGILGEVGHYYLHWCGRFSFLLLISVLERFLPAHVWFLPGVMLALWTCGLFAFFRQVTCAAGAAALSVAIPAATLSLAPALRESLYWEASATTYLPPLIGLCWMAAYLLTLSRRDRFSPHDFAIAACLPFINAGFSETIAALQIPILLCLLILARGRRVFPVVGIAGVGALAGLAAVFFAPGNKIREACFPPHGPMLGVLAKSAHDTLAFLYHSLYFRFPDIFDINQWDGYLPVVFAVSFFALMAGPRDRKQPLWMAACIVPACALLIFLCFLPARYGMDDLLPARAQVIPCFLLVSSAAALGFLLAPYIALKSRAAKGSAAIIWLWLIVNVPLTQARAVRSDLAPMQAFAARWDAQDAEYKAAALSGRDAAVTHLDPYQRSPNCTVQTRWDVAAERAYYHLTLRPHSQGF